MLRTSLRIVLHVDPLLDEQGFLSSNAQDFIEEKCIQRRFPWSIDS